jgi:predicted acyltransferase
MSPADTQPAPAAPSAPGSSRLLSLDALRGFDMFWILGADEIVYALNNASDSPFVSFLKSQLDHKAWAGLAFYDLIFPLFVFIAGVSLVFSLTRTVEQHGKTGALKRVFFRAILLYLVGIFYYGGISGGVEKIRLLGVLQRIALAYFFAGLLFINFRLKGLIIAFASLLAGYWALMTFVPVPGVGAGNFDEGKNLANYLDKMYLPFRKWDGDHDPEGLLSTLPAIGTCLLGVFAGLWIRNPQKDPQTKVVRLLIAGILSVLLGFLWNLQFPIIKKVWTSSFVLAAGGYACIFLAVFYQIIEIWKIQKWASPFVWIGMNPITLYLSSGIIHYEKVASWFVGGPVKKAAGPWGDTLMAVFVMGLIFLFARFLYKRKIFLRL